MRPCNQCGKCCLHYADGGLVATTEEIEDWEVNRPDIHQYVHEGQIWCSPTTHEPLPRCPFLQGTSKPYSCGIYLDRPRDCRSYPVTIADMVRDECEMIELKDLRDERAAQRALESFME